MFCFHVDLVPPWVMPKAYALHYPYIGYATVIYPRNLAMQIETHLPSKPSCADRDTKLTCSPGPPSLPDGPDGPGSP